MLSCCLKCRKNTESKNSKVAMTKDGIIMLLSKCDNKKSRFIKQQEASGLLNSLGKLSYLSRSSFVLTVLNKLIAGDKFIKNKESTQKFKET